MKVLVLGGTGSIGSAVVEAFTARRHEVTALARTAAATEQLTCRGARVLPGDIREPAAWISSVDGVDAVIHAAATFSADAAAIDRVLLDALLTRLGASPSQRAFVYTGGCWLYGATGESIATEESPFAAPAAWAWSVGHLTRVLDADSCRGMVVHPAMVYERDGGVLGRFHDDLAAFGRVRVVGSESVRWPLVHRQDLGLLYCLMAERGTQGSSYNGAAVESISVGALARAMTRRTGVAAGPIVRPVEEVVAELGEWASGFAIDQRMSGAKARRELGWTPTHTDPIAEIS